MKAISKQNQSLNEDFKAADNKHQIIKLIKSIRPNKEISEYQTNQQLFSIGMIHYF